MPSNRTLVNPEGSHLNEVNFRRYEQLLVKFAKCYPHPFKFRPELAVSTTLVRIREAGNAFIQKQFESSLDYADFSQKWKSVVVVGRGEWVIIGTKEAQVEAIRISEPSTNSVTIRNPTVANLLSLCELLSSGAFQEPVTLTGVIPAFTPPLGIAFEKQEDGSYIIL